MISGTGTEMATPPGVPAGTAAGRSRFTPQEAAVRIGSVVVIIWLIIGAIAAGQRGYFSSGSDNCAKASTTIVTIVAGPLNYLGINPKVNCPTVPQPSK